MNESKEKIKAGGLLSGGLDSVLAAKMMKDMDIEVYAVYFSMPWGCKEKSRVEKMCEDLDLHFKMLQLDEGYMDMLKAPQYGYGRALNPCTDCHAYMISRAAEYMKSIGAAFVFTGEVMGQRPKSQRKNALAVIEKGTALDGRLLRPLCAHLLEPTVPEMEGMIDRSRLLGISGRSRKIQFQLAKEWGIEGFATPAGGCLLTEEHFSRRMKDILIHGYRDLSDVAVLKWGRYFRLSPQFTALIGRDETENEAIEKHAHPDDHVLVISEDRPGPSLLLRGGNPPDEIFAQAGGLVQLYSKWKGLAPVDIIVRQIGCSEIRKKIQAARLTGKDAEALRV